MHVEFDERKIDAVFGELDQGHRPGAAVGIAIEGEPIYRKGFGLANIEQSVRLLPQTRMRIFSVSKQFTSLAYMLLCEDGSACLDEGIGKYLPELHPVAGRVTPRQLMGNIGGLHDVFDITWHLNGTGWTVESEELFSLYRGISSINALPGTAWIYNNGGFLILSIAIERITGKALEDVLRDRIFAPIGMSNTMLRRFDTDFVPNSATLHVTDSGTGYRKSYLGTAVAGEGGIVSTIDDMLRWMAHMDTPLVGNAATWETIKAPQRLANGTSTCYGLGLGADRYRGVATLAHSGSGMGGGSHIAKVPDAGLDIVVMTNRDDPGAILLVDRILDACLPGLAPIKAIKHPLAEGTFQSSTTHRVVQLVAVQGRQIASINGTDLPVEPDADGVLWTAGAVRFTKQGVRLAGDPMQPQSVQLNDFGNLDQLARSAPSCKREGGMIAGRYSSETADGDANVCETENGPQLIMSGRFGSVLYQLACIGKGLWRASSPRVGWLGGILSFDKDARSFRFSTYRTRALIFRRK
jgi:D-aminopeptidase